ncbi:MAG TPA: hypothetical protein VFO19_16540 [Vicinamibacterales bacterium]|nr:hypothetical protein [Vicinamibacterales bacterium]
MSWSRRSFLSTVSTTPLALAPLGARVTGAGISQAAAAPASFPVHDPALVQEVVGVAHRDLARVRELVGGRPTLANAAVDWGFGDWESALGAASHVGNRDIAEYLIAHGARPTLFSAAMLGQLDIVKAFVALSPGCQRIKGPHGIPLLSHAQAGGDRAKAVYDYLLALGDAGERPALQPLSSADRDRLIGTYAYGPGSDEQFEISAQRDFLVIARKGRVNRNLMHVGSLEFFPVGAESVRIRFSSDALTVTIRDAAINVIARRIAS